MTQRTTRDRGFEDAKRALYRNGGVWNVNRLRKHLKGKFPATYRRGYLGYFLSRGLITEGEFRRLREELAPLSTTPSRQPKSTQSQAAQSNRTTRNDPLPAVRAKPATLVRGQSVRCRCDVPVVAGVTHCPQCGWLVRPKLFEEQSRLNRERWSAIT